MSVQYATYTITITFLDKNCPYFNYLVSKKCYRDLLATNGAFFTGMEFQSYDTKKQVIKFMTNAKRTYAQDLISIWIVMMDCIRKILDLNKNNIPNIMFEVDPDVMYEYTALPESPISLEYILENLDICLMDSFQNSKSQHEKIITGKSAILTYASFLVQALYDDKKLLENFKSTILLSDKNKDVLNAIESIIGYTLPTENVKSKYFQFIIDELGIEAINGFPGTRSPLDYAGYNLSKDIDSITDFRNIIITD